MIQHQNNAIAGVAQESMNAIGAGEPRPQPARRGPEADRHQPAGRVGIMGATAAGIGIARSLLTADIPVTLHEAARESLDQATAALRSEYQESVGKGELTPAQRDRRVALLAATINLHHLKDCDVIVDALGMDLATREALVRRLNEVARPDAVLMTRAADLDQIAAVARFPANVLGYHLSGSATAWELVPAKATSRGTLAAATRLLATLGVPPQAVLPPAMSLA